MLDGNKQFVEKVFGPGNLARLKDGQKPHTCWIGCSDSRAPAGLITGTGAGELFVYRNLANIVPPDDPAMGAVLEYAVEHLKVGQIVLCGHYGCGGMAALWKGLEKGTRVAGWLKNGNAALKRVRERGDAANLTEAKALRLLVEENLRVQREHLLRYPLVRDALKKEHVRIHVVVYDIATGRLKELKK